VGSDRLGYLHGQVQLLDVHCDEQWVVRVPSSDNSCMYVCMHVCMYVCMRKACFSRTYTSTTTGESNGSFPATYTGTCGYTYILIYLHISIQAGVVFRDRCMYVCSVCMNVCLYIIYR
jgi:hypothetical protein